MHVVVIVGAVVLVVAATVYLNIVRHLSKAVNKPSRQHLSLCSIR